MKKTVIFCLISLLITFSLSAADKVPAVILKLDDLKGRSGKEFLYPGWKRVADFLAKENIKSSFGIIANDLEKDKPEYFAWVKKNHESGLIEFWNHGYTHGKVDYNGKKVGVFAAGPEIQEEYFTKAQKLAKEKLGFPFNTFGSPFNSISPDTAKVLAKDPDLKVWLYGNDSYAKKGGFSGMVMGRKINLEIPTFNPNYDKFVERFEKGGLGDVIVIQGHPNGWDAGKWDAFVKIIGYLQEKGCEFTTPIAYFNSKSKQ